MRIGGASGGVYLDQMDVIDWEISVHISDILQPGANDREIFIGP